MGAPTDLNTDEGYRFVVDCTRAAEGLATDQELSEKYELSPADWQNIKKDKLLERAIRAERERRVFSGVAARESAAKHFVKGPSILDQIATDSTSNARHKIDALRELRATAAVGSGNGDRPAGGEMFIIRIDLTAGGGDVTEKTVTINATNGDNLIEGKPDVEGQW